MASNPPPRASTAERRATLAASRQQQSRPTSAATERLRHGLDESRSSSSAGTTRRTTTTTTERTSRRVLEQEAVIRRTRTPLQTTSANEERRPSLRTEKEASTTPRPAAKEPHAPSWRPVATLLPPTPAHAPLASRISVPPQAKHAPETLYRTSMSGMGLAAREQALIDDLLFVLLGFEGQYITFALEASGTQDRYNPMDEQSRLAGPTYQIASGVDPSLRDLAMQVLKTATHVAALEAFGEVMSRTEHGSVSHALCAAIRTLQKEFMSLVAQLENQHLTNDHFSLHQMSLQMRKAAHIMAQLYGLAREVLKENGMLGSAAADDDDNEVDEDDFDNMLASLTEGPGATTKKRSCIGGALLALVTRRLQALSGDPQAKELLSNLLKEASRPYVRMLNEWLHHGNVRDPHAEFMVKETKSIRREGLEQDYTDEYWEKRYTLQPHLTPPQLIPIQDRILLAGKYLNVVRECSSGETFTQTFTTDLTTASNIPHTIFDPNLLANANKAYTSANSALMSLLLTTHALPQRLKSLKHYFFLDRSDWFTSFLELSHSELRKPAKSARTEKLQSLLDLVLHAPGSVAAEDPFKEDVRVSLADTGLTGWLMRVVNVQGMDADASSLNASYTPAAGTESVNGKEEKEISAYEALTLDFGVPFPLSLIISRVTLTRYQLLFRYLLSLKHLEAQLISSWSDAGGIGCPSRKGAEKGKDGVWRRHTGNARAEMWKKRAWCLRARMLTFTQQLLYFCTAEVIEPHWRALMSRLDRQGEHEGAAGSGVGKCGSEEGKRRTVDELMQDHVDFLATCLKECMLTNSKLLRINAKVTTTCSNFARYTASLTKNLDDACSLASSTNPSEARAAVPGGGVDEAKLDKLFSVLAQYETHFSRHLKILLDALNYLAATETVGFLGLCARLSMAAEGGGNGVGSGPGEGRGGL